MASGSRALLTRKKNSMPVVTVSDVKFQIINILEDKTLDKSETLGVSTNRIAIQSS